MLALSFSRQNGRPTACLLPPLVALRDCCLADGVGPHSPYPDSTLGPLQMMINSSAVNRDYENKSSEIKRIIDEFLIEETYSVN
jgi:hypothetical protein